MPDSEREALFAQVRGFMESRIVLTGVELGLFDLLRDQWRTADEVARAVQGNLRGVTILLDALTALGRLEKQDGRYRTAPPTARYLCSDSPDSILPIIQHYSGLWRRWSNLTDIVRGQRTYTHADVTRTPEQLRAFIGGMHVLGRERAPLVVQQVNAADARALLDIGGASGTYTIAFLRACPGMRATLFDLPEVIELARERLTEEALLDRVTLVAGDYNRDSFPPDHDLAFLSAIIHQNSHEQNVALYRRCFEALMPGGRIIIRDHVLSEDRTTPRAGAIFAVNMLCGTEGGNSYTFGEIAGGLREAGFVDVRLLHQDSIMDGLVEARKPV